MNEGIEEIDMTGNPIGNEGGMEFAAMLQVNTILTRLLLSNCKLTANALIALSTVLANTHKIRVLDISNNENNFSRLTQSLANDVMLHLSKMMAANRAIDILAFGKMGVSDFMVTEYLARAVLNNRKIARLDLRCNKITRDGGVALCQSLYKQMFLTHLNLSCCAIQDEGAEAVSVMLLHNKILTTLYLDHNRIARKGLRQLADVIAHKNRTLSSLRLWGNLWDEYACIDFAPVIGGARGGGGTSGDVPEPTNGIQRRPPSNGFSSKLTEEQQNARLKPDQVDFCFYVVDKVLHVCENEDTGGNREFSCAIQE
ncbi:hypothetical protein BJ741DRAFT_319425 [Chytriomyces cf. hyalinus JEL632]|nr:hypothetical protein BJ741DRAFT_319425 [Chytriomyces cf. hyalinus JEL632]